MLLFKLVSWSSTFTLAIQAFAQSPRPSCSPSKMHLLSEGKLWPTFAAPIDLGNAKRVGQAAQAAPHEMDFAYYSIRDGFTSVLHLVSVSSSPITFVVTVHSLDGQSLRLDPISLPALQTMDLDLVNIPALRENRFREGSISVSYAGTGQMPLAGQVTVQNSARRLVFESRMVENDGMGAMPSLLHGVWWNLSAEREATIAVSNVANEKASAQVILELHGKQYENEEFVLASHETKLLSIKDLLSDAHVPIEKATEGGVTIAFRGNPTMASLIAQGRILDRTTGFSTTLNFLSAQNLVSNVFYASGVPIAVPSAGSPYSAMGSFIPHVVVRNLADSSQTVSLTLTFPGVGGPQ